MSEYDECDAYYLEVDIEFRIKRKFMLGTNDVEWNASGEPVVTAQSIYDIMESRLDDCCFDWQGENGLTYYLPRVEDIWVSNVHCERCLGVVLAPEIESGQCAVCKSALMPDNEVVGPW